MSSYRMRIAAIGLAFAFWGNAFLSGQQVNWIWTTEHTVDNIPIGKCYFRKAFRMLQPDRGQIQISANDQLEVYINGHLLGQASGSDALARFDISKHLVAGVNVVAVQVNNTEGRTAGLAAAVVVKERDERQWRMLPTNDSWHASTRYDVRWMTPAFDDSRWFSCQIISSQTPESGSVAQDNSAHPGEDRTEIAANIETHTEAPSATPAAKVAGTISPDTPHSRAEAIPPRARVSEVTGRTRVQDPSEASAPRLTANRSSDLGWGWLEAIKPTASRLNEQRVETQTTEVPRRVGDSLPGVQRSIADDDSIAKSVASPASPSPATQLTQQPSPQSNSTPGGNAIPGYIPRSEGSRSSPSLTKATPSLATGEVTQSATPPQKIKIIQPSSTPTTQRPSDTSVSRSLSDVFDTPNTPPSQIPPTSHTPPPKTVTDSSKSHSFETKSATTPPRQTPIGGSPGDSPKPSMTTPKTTTAEASQPAIPALPPAKNVVVDRSTPTTPKTPTTTPKESSEAKTDRPSYEIDPEFEVSTVIDNTLGSLIAMEFDEFGRLIVSQEGAGLARVDFRLPADHPQRTQKICDAVQNCQGILPLNGQIWVTGQGPNGLGLYLLSDRDNDGRFERIEQKLVFQGQPGEHGPHGIVLGPDGYLYIAIGNHSGVAKTSESSPYAHPYDADLVPRVEDPGGHAVGIKAPGGTIVRMRVDGQDLQTVAGGIRNAYDLAFDEYGELLIHDSDMESDVGTPWYRPTMLFQVLAGSEFGWRSGWAKYPTYYVDVTPPIAEVGRGSPTGSVVYSHIAFPARFHNALFLADWSEGRILVAKLQANGSMYQAETRSFLSSPAFNVTDLAVGPDGALYFCTGGRGTHGSVGRIAWRGRVPESIENPDTAVQQILLYPQPQSAWARQGLARFRSQAGDQWGPLLEHAILDHNLPPVQRVRAMNLLTLYGPTPSRQLWVEATRDPDPRVRARACRGLMTESDSQNATELVNMLNDSSPLVRRVACESLARCGAHLNLDQIVPCLVSTDRGEAFAARRLLESMPLSHWRDPVLQSLNIRLFTQGSLAAITVAPSLETSYAVLAHGAEFLDGFISDADFIDLLRVMELALAQGHVLPQKIPAFAERIANEFPSTNGLINTELSRILAYLRVSHLDHRYAQYLSQSSDPPAVQLHVCLMLQTLADQLDAVDRNAMIDNLETAIRLTGGGSYEAYLRGALNNLTRQLTREDIATVLRQGARWPNAVTAVLYLLDENADDGVVQQLIGIDIDARAATDASSRRMRAAIMAILLAHGKPASYDYLLTCLSDLEEPVAIEVLLTLRDSSFQTTEVQNLRQVIEVAGRLPGPGALAAIALLEKWTGRSFTDPAADAQSAFQRWKFWYESEFPDAKPISIPSAHSADSAAWTPSQLLDEMSALTTTRDWQHGRQLFVSAQCARCHRFENLGENRGPDLTSIASHYSLKEIVEATVEPSRFIPEQFRGKKILTTSGKTISGLLSIETDGSWVVFAADGQRVALQPNDVEDVSDMSTSTMPDGLLDKLSAADVADLMHYLTSSPSSRFAETAQGSNAK